MSVATPSVDAALRAAVEARCFPRARPPAGPPRVGAEVELIPVRAASGRRVPIEGPDGGCALLRALAAEHGWQEHLSSKGTPHWTLPEGTLSFEPGGQIELSADPAPSVTALAERIERVLATLARGAEQMGIVLLDVGMDPTTPAEELPLQLDVPRYRRMTAYFDAIGPHGVRMMRASASMHVSLDAGDAPAERWRLLNGLAPLLIATFANSPRYAGELTRHQSYRAHCWRGADPGRTGIAARDGGEPADDYAEFALAAPDMLRGAGGECEPFGAWVARGDWDAAALERHLSTLFPEVRPRGHLEVRSVDVLPREWLLVPLVLLSGLVYDREASREAAALVPGTRPLLAAAGRDGLRDPRLASAADAVTRLALEGAARLGEGYVDGASRERAAEFFRRYTWRGRSPADDARERSAARADAVA